MRLDAQVESESLTAFATEAINLLCRGDIDTLARRFGYASSHCRETATAIREDLRYCLSQLGAASLAVAPEHPVRRVQYFEKNSSNLLAVIECLAFSNNGASLLVELVVTSRAEETHLTLEDISVPRGDA